MTWLIEALRLKALWIYSYMGCNCICIFITVHAGSKGTKDVYTFGY